jgi:hypothetical protein
MQTALPPQSLTDAERVNEAAHILATGIIRWRKSQQESDFPLDFSPTKSVHHDRYPHGELSR